MAAAAVILLLLLPNYTIQNPWPACAFVRRCDTTADWSEILIVAGTGTIRRAVTTITIHRQSSCTPPPPPPWQRLYYYYYCCGTTRSAVVVSRCRRSSGRTRVRECMRVCVRARAARTACLRVCTRTAYDFVLFFLCLTYYNTTLHEATRCSGPGVCRV